MQAQKETRFYLKGVAHLGVAHLGVAHLGLLHFIHTLSKLKFEPADSRKLCGE